MAANSVSCYNPSSFIDISFGTFTPSVGQFYYASDGIVKTENCIEIIYAVDNPLSSVSAQTLYTNCYECMAANRGYVTLVSCSSDQLQFIVFISDLGFLPSSNDVFYMSITNLGGRNTPGIYESCFYINKITIMPIVEYNKVLTTGSYALVNSYTAETDCQTCIDNNSKVYLVERCNDDEPYYVSLLPGLTGNLISFQVGVDQFCGVVKEEFLEPVTGIFIFDFGNGTPCETCLSINSQKTLLESCKDPLVQIVVWSSSLYSAGQISNLSSRTGCYKVIGPTELDVTDPSYFDFDPQPDCETCLQCNGFTYDFNVCGTEEVGQFSSNQILNNSDIFYHPVLGTCCIIVGVNYGISSPTFFSSVRYFGNGVSNCDTCNLESGGVTIYAANLCGSLVQVFLSSFNTLSLGEIVKIKFGDLNFLCAEITDVVIGETTNIFDVVTQPFSNNTLVYATCDDCTTENLGLTVVRCSNGTEQYVSISHNDWLKITGYYLPNIGSAVFPFSNFKLDDGLCYESISFCPIPLSATTNFVSVTESYSLCSFCSEGEPPRSANTESTICIICCPCTTGETITSVSPPHPVWTDSQGTSVTQLNAITLGGMFGLNN